MTYLNGISAASNVVLSDPMDVDEAVGSRYTESQDQITLADKALSERAAQLYGEKGFFLSLPEVCLIRLMTYLILPSFRNLSETSKESHQRLMAIFQPKDQWMNQLTPLQLGKRFILENLEKSQGEIEEKLLILNQARIFTNDIMDAEPMSRGEIRQGLSYGLFEGSLYRFSLHLLALKKAREGYNQALQLDKKLTLKNMFKHYDADRQSILKAVQRGTAKITDLFSLKSLVTPPEISQMRSFTELHCFFGGSVHKIPMEIYSFTQLTELSLMGEFRDVLADIQNLKQLTYLTLSSSHLQSLPPEIGELPQLKDLHLPACSKLRNLPESFVHLKLQVLNITMSGIVVVNLSGPLQSWIQSIRDLRGPHLSYERYRGDDDTRW
jgi:hypothetical protein